jgi:hypothetical protein
MRSWRPFCCGWPGLIRSIAMPSRSHQTDSFERLNKALGLAKGTPLSERMASGKPRSRNNRSKAVQANLGLHVSNRALRTGAGNARHGP